MGRVFVKYRYDAGNNMEILHSLNFATAMYGFQQMGAEIIPYHYLDEIYDGIERNDIVLDYIDQCNQVFQ